MKGGPIVPANFRNQYAGRPITLREAIARSDNVYAVHTHFLIGRDRLMETARRLGFTSPFKPVPSLALGSIPVSPYEMTRAYAALAAGGVLTEPVGILRIEDAEGKTIAESRPDQRRVASEAETFVLTQLLQSVFESGGTGHRVKQIFPHPSAGKTGSTDWDGWLAGYTPDLAATVWVGYDRAKKLPHEEGRLAQMIWGTFMQRPSPGNPSAPFGPGRGEGGVCGSGHGASGHKAMPQGALGIFRLRHRTEGRMPPSSLAGSGKERRRTPSGIGSKNGFRVFENRNPGALPQGLRDC